MYLFLRCPFSSLKLLIGFLLNALFSGGLKIFLQKHSCFFFTSKKIKYQSNLAASFDLAVTNRGIIIYTGNYTFPIAIMSVFMTKLYMQHLHSSFWFLTSYKRQLSNKRAPPSYERLTSKCSFYYKPVNYLTGFFLFLFIPLLKMARHNNLKIYNAFYQKNCFICRHSSQRLMIRY